MASDKIKKPALSVKAPIVMPGEGFGALRDFIAGLEAHSNVEAAEMESERLTPWFEAASGYLNDALSKARGARRGIKRLKKLTTPEKLKSLFNGIAARMRNTFLSDVAIVPASIAHDPALGKRVMLGKYEYHGSEIGFGFIQIYADGKMPPLKGSSTTIAIHTLDDKRMAILERQNRKDLLESLQAVLALVNHDMLHHYTSFVVRDEVAYSYVDRYDIAYGARWNFSLPGDYETWALATHEKIHLHPSGAKIVDNMSRQVEKYFSGLHELVISLMADGQSVTEAHQVVDFFGMVMMQTLARVFPLTHPLMAKALRLLEWADPAPEQAAQDCCRTAIGVEANLEIVKDMLSDNFSMAWRAAERHPTGWWVLRTYRENGFIVFPYQENDAATPTYAQYKMLQMVAMGGLQAHAPDGIYIPGQAGSLKDLRDSDTLLSLVRALSKDTGIGPSA